MNSKDFNDDLKQNKKFFYNGKPVSVLGSPTITGKCYVRTDGKIMKVNANDLTLSNENDISDIEKLAQMGIDARKYLDDTPTEKNNQSKIVHDFSSLDNLIEKLNKKYSDKKL